MVSTLVSDSVAVQVPCDYFGGKSGRFAVFQSRCVDCCVGLYASHQFLIIMLFIASFIFCNSILNCCSLMFSSIADDASFIATNSFSLIAQSPFIFSKYGIEIKDFSDCICFRVSYALVHIIGASLIHRSFAIDIHTAHLNHSDVRMSFARSILFFAFHTNFVDSICFQFDDISAMTLVLSADGSSDIFTIQSITACASGEIAPGIPGAVHGVQEAHHCVIKL